MWDVNYDWVLLSTSYTYQILFIHIKIRCLPYFICSGQSYACVSLLHWYHMVVPLWLVGLMVGQVVGFWHKWYCYVVIGAFHPLHTHTRPTSYILNKMFGHTLYAVGSHMSVSLLRIWFGSGRRYNRKVYCWWYAVNLVFNPLYTLIKSIIHIHKLFELLYFKWC